MRTGRPKALNVLNGELLTSCKLRDGALARVVDADGVELRRRKIL